MALKVTSSSETPLSGYPSGAPRLRGRKSIAGLQVLVAEDQEMVRDLVSILLAREKVCATLVQNGAEAVAAASSQAFDVILMDMRMPVMGGFEATKAIRQSQGPSANVPILALTSNVQKAEIAQCLRAGMDGHIAKPFTTDALATAIAAIVFGPAQ